MKLSIEQMRALKMVRSYGENGMPSTVFDGEHPANLPSFVPLVQNGLIQFSGMISRRYIGHTMLGIYVKFPGTMYLTEKGKAALESEAA